MAERSAKQLGLSKADLPNSIIEVISTLNQGGFDAYIVGGGVRDSLLELSPKDFDAVTDARPHEVKDIFGKRCRIIGRRFQLAHVYSGRDMIEVATFRAPPNGDAHTTSDGMIVRDNVWGDIKQDFARRDFSINAMYYQPIKGVVHDFCNALDDIKNKTLRLLGHAPLRIEEDPVRLLRALRFKAKLGFEFDKELSEQFHDDNWSLLDQVSPHRLYDESQKMFTGGYLVPLLPLLFEYGAIRHLIIYPPEAPSALVKQVAVNTDKRIAQGKSINPAFFYAALLWDNYLHQLAKFKKKNMPFHDAQLQATSKVIDRQRIKTAIPKFAEQFIRDIWMMQPKLAKPRVKQITQLAEHARFRAAYDFLLLREQCGDDLNPLSESTNGMGEWWQTYQTLSEKQKQQAIDDFANDSRRGASKSSRKRNRNRNKNSDTAQNTVVEAVVATKTGDYQAKPPKHVAPSTPDTPNKDKHSTKEQHSTAANHLAKERAQLEKLSLGKPAGEKVVKHNQPSPLFIINADKMAKQVPNQSDAETQVERAESHHKKHEQAKNTQTKPKAEPTSSTLKDTKVASATQSGSSSDVNPTQENIKQLSNGVVVLPKSEPVPTKRRRRLPTQATTQTQLAKASTETDNLESATQKSLETSSQGDGSNQKKDKVNQKTAAHKKAIKPAVTRTKKAKVAGSDSSGSEVASDKQQSSGNQKAQVKEKKAMNNSVIVAKSERVPATRRRRAPSSTLSVNERNS